MPYFYDTYAILEYTSGNKRYSRYFEEDYGFLTVLNLMEIYYALLKEHSYADALGYQLSMKFKVKFLTGDLVFKDLENVEYVR